MVGKYTFLGLLLLVLYSCAQVGTITGGEKDAFAPKPVESKISPPNETTNFSASEITIPFDEFIRLNNPTQNIRIVPPHATIEPSIKGKTLTLRWEDTLEPSTTYSIYLNGAVKDITEGNDSIIQYVFSTGSFIDTLSYTTFVYSAKEISPESNITVGLYKTDSMEVVNFARTDDSGKASLKYLKPGAYRLFAFDDVNNNLVVDPAERVAFKDNAEIQLTQNTTDTVPMMLFQPVTEPKVRTFQFNAPGAFIIGSNVSIEDEKLSLNGEIINREDYRFYSEDSLVLYTKNIEPTTYELILECSAFTDTITSRVSASRINNAVLLRSKNKTVAPSEQLEFVLNDKILSVDTSLIYLKNAKDSSRIKITGYHLSVDELFIEMDKADIGEVIAEFDTSAIVCNQGTSPYHLSRLTLNNDRKYGVLSLDLSAYSSSVVLELYHDGKLVQTLPVNTPSDPLKLAELDPGSYSFRVIQDTNSNGRWDTGSLEKMQQPEKIDIYSEGVTVRANWEVEVPLRPTNE